MSNTTPQGHRLARSVAGRLKPPVAGSGAAFRPAPPGDLCRLREPRLGDLLAADVRLFFQHMIDGANVDNVGRRDLMLILADKMSQPDIDGFFKCKFSQGKLRYQEPVVDDLRITH